MVSQQISILYSGLAREIICICIRHHIPSFFLRRSILPQRPVFYLWHTNINSSINMPSPPKTPCVKQGFVSQPWSERKPKEPKDAYTEHPSSCELPFSTFSNFNSFSSKVELTPSIHIHMRDIVFALCFMRNCFIWIWITNILARHVTLTYPLMCLYIYIYSWCICIHICIYICKYWSCINFYNFWQDTQGDPHTWLWWAVKTDIRNQSIL